MCGEPRDVGELGDAGDAGIEGNVGLPGPQVYVWNVLLIVDSI